MGLSITEAARHLGVSRKTLSKFLNGRGAVTPEMALRLEMTFSKPTAAHWLRLQNAFALCQGLAVNAWQENVLVIHALPPKSLMNCAIDRPTLGVRESAR